MLFILLQFNKLVFILHYYFVRFSNMEQPLKPERFEIDPLCSGLNRSGNTGKKHSLISWAR